ncbi:glycosyltransferase [Tautonia rosea]|uniref:glycosyltransferase n=1 Tax=Tautonia rosea TaxID=2728037 RepID=UPI001475BE98|nr:glycosyltransferase [Tautonia rosea]
MRLGIDLLPLQSEGSRERGVGRYAAALLHSMAKHAQADEWVLYSYSELPFDRVPELTGPRVRIVSVGTIENDDTIRGRWQTIATQNPDRLDGLLLLNPFELGPGFEPPPRTPGGLPIIAVLYDLIPLLFPETYLSDPGVRRRYFQRLDTLRRYDCLLAISDSTRRDAEHRLGIRADRVVTLPLTVDPRFGPDSANHRDPETLARLGLSTPFLFHLGGRDDRKNVWAALDAFAMLDPAIRSGHTLVVAGAYDPAYRSKINAYARERRIDDRLIIPSEVDDATLEALYRGCVAFVFPSHYEGLGLPILEAMRSGAPVIAGRNSSQTDLVGDSGILVDPSDSEAIARAITRLINDRPYALTLAESAIRRAATLCRASQGSVARAAIVDCLDAKLPRPHFRLRTPRPRVAMVSPFPPKATGIADYAQRLALALHHHASVDLYHDGDYVPELGLSDRRFRCFDRATFARRLAVLPPQAIIYQMGNSWYHRFVYECLRERPGITVLHDFHLAGFHFWYANQPDVASGHFDRIVAQECTAGLIGPEENPETWQTEPGGVQAAAMRRGIAMNREIFERSRFVVVHSPYCRDLVRQTMPEFVDRTVVIPMGASLNRQTQAQITATRQRFGIPTDAIVFGCFGNLTSMKMYEEAIQAFAHIRHQVGRALLLFVGKDWEQGRASARVQAEGLTDRVLFLGPALKADYERLVGAVDVGLGLRRPPTYGETSASLLDFLRSGIATIVTDVASFRDYPPETVVSWNPDQDSIDGLADRMCELATNPSARRTIGEAALTYVQTRHDWSIAARAYSELAAQCAEASASSIHTHEHTHVSGVHDG